MTILYWKVYWKYRDRGITKPDYIFDAYDRKIFGDCDKDFYGTRYTSNKTPKAWSL